MSASMRLALELSGVNLNTGLKELAFSDSNRIMLRSGEKNIIRSNKKKRRKKNAIDSTVDLKSIL